jgi:hypothetical protein
MSFALPLTNASGCGCHVFGIDTSYLYIEYVFGLRSLGLVKGKITVKPNTKLLPMVCGF